MTEFQPSDPDFESRVRGSFARQPFMGFIGAEIVRVEPGLCEIRLPYREELSQQHGFFHGGVVGALADNAAGYAAFSLMGREDSILTVEYKLNLLSPGQGRALLARGVVIKPGRTLTVTHSQVFAVEGEREKLCATAQSTMIALKGQPEG